MPYASANGVKIYYEVHGQGPAITLVHGSGGHHAAWFQQVPYLARFYTVVLPDLRGFGLSDPVQGGPDSHDFVHDLRAIAEATGIEKSVYLGQSIGALPCLHLALAHPEKVAGVILAHSLGGISDPEIKERQLANRAEAEKLPVMDRLLSREFRAGNPEMAWLFKEQGTFNAATMQDLRNLNAQGPTCAQIDASGVPVHFLAGGKDAVLWPDTVRLAAEKLKNGTISVVPDGPHSMYWEEPRVFNSEVHKFLREVYGQ
ncbi:MAG: alpha/beta fold hydrolase [Qingshengfaniella sp.]